VKAIRFADDQAMVADTEKGLQEIMDVLHATSKPINHYSRRKETGTSNTIYLLKKLANRG